MTDEWDKAKVLRLLETNDMAVARAVAAINKRQEYDEQNEERTKYRNGRGFRPCHARMGTSMAEYFERHGKLTTKQVAWWRVKDKDGNMRIGIYANQLVTVIEGDN